ncbi:MAG TPA: damage-control phosphatase ARMT1 family protein [Chloroflexota bacterium]|nr:damage-control phosphatase ARMT1 family protein [Chloroflexota bacterium]
MQIRPKLPVPPPLRGADRGSFAEDTIKRRLPEIARRVLRENDLQDATVAAIESLVAEMPYALIRPLTDIHAPDTAVWQPAIDRYRSQNWLEIPWFVAETYFFRRIIEAVDYFHTGLDPYRTQKEEALMQRLTAVPTLSHELVLAQNAGWQEDVFHRLLLAALWGNQVDLSLWTTDAAEKPDHTDDKAKLAHVFVDESTAVTDHLYSLDQIRLDMLIDNAGPELLADLMLADYLLTCGKVRQVNLHLKMFPTFVSDATPQDLAHTVDTLCKVEVEPVRLWGERLVRAQADGRIQTHTHPFMTSPHPLWQMSDEFRRELAQADLVISKGDANYRRALGDAHWPFTTPFADVVSYLPTPILFLRVCKSNVLAGLTPDQLTTLNAQDINWVTSGRWGLLQWSIDN